MAPDIEIQSDSAIGDHRLPKGRYEYEDQNGTGIWFIGGNEYFYMRKADGLICIHQTNQCAAIPYLLDEKLDRDSLQADWSQQTLIYNGKVGNRITLGYREFEGNLARPAYSNIVDYDLTESRILGYQGARLEVLEATNTQIT